MSGVHSAPPPFPAVSPLGLNHEHIDEKVFSALLSGFQWFVVGPWGGLGGHRHIWRNQYNLGNDTGGIPVTNLLEEEVIIA